MWKETSGVAPSKKRYNSNATSDSFTAQSRGEPLQASTASFSHRGGRGYSKDATTAPIDAATRQAFPAPGNSKSIVLLAPGGWGK
ncbi:unnamed protein product [Lampetra planeri]